MRFIPTSTHAVLDYLAGIVLIIAPWIFSFNDESQSAKWISIIAGIVLIVMSLVTDYEGGFVARAIPMPTHLAADAILGVVLILAPWVVGFHDHGANAWLPFVVLGIIELGAALMTCLHPSRRSMGRTAHTVS